MTNNPQIFESHPDPYRFDKAIELEDYVKKLLSSVVRLHFRNDKRLSKSSLTRIERVTLTIQMYLEGIPDKIIASALECSTSTVSRDIKAIEPKLIHFDTLHLRLIKRLEEADDALGRKVLDGYIKGKSREEIISKSGREPEVVDETWDRIRKMAREMQKEFEASAKQNAETDNGSDGQYPTGETIN
jgi:hypothetical protein